MEVEKRPFCKQYMQIKYFEASWQAASVAHRIQPLPGSINAYMKKGGSSENYALMCKKLMAMIQEYLVLNVDETREALEYLPHRAKHYSAMPT